MLFTEELLPPVSYREELANAAAVIRRLVDTPTPAGKIIRYALDVASDEYIANEFYQVYPELLPFLVQCGTTDEEVRFREWQMNHHDILHCRMKGCSGKLIGGCPVVVCDTCGTHHYVNIEGISTSCCERCAAQKLRECIAENRTRLHTIYCSDGVH